MALSGCGTISFYSARAKADDEPVPPTKEPSHHLALQNDYVRVFKVEVAPHATTLLHKHDGDYIWVALGPASVTNLPQGKPASKLTARDGEVHFTPGPLIHRAQNDSDQPFRNVTVELLKPNKGAKPPQGEERGLDVGHGGASVVETLFIEDGVIAKDITIAPYQSVMYDALVHSRPNLLVMVSDTAELEHREDMRMPHASHEKGATNEALACQQSSHLERSLRAGDVEWTDAGASPLPGSSLQSKETHPTSVSYVNCGKEPVRFIMLVFP